MTHLVLTAVLSGLLPSMDAGSQLPVSESRTATVTATIEAIDREKRIVRLRRRGATALTSKCPARWKASAR